MKTNTSLQAMLRKSGYKATRGRLAVLELFKKNKNPISAQEVINALPAAFDQATTYRTIKSLKIKGLIRQIDLRHNHAHYELADIDDHHHLICLRCGRIEDVEHCGVEKIQSAILDGSKHFKEIRQHALEFYGICKACEKKDDASKIPPHKSAPL